MISLYDLIEASNGQLFGEPAAQLFDGFCLDARKAAPNQLFVALKTEQGDTHQYISEAIQNGVSGVICQRPPEHDTDGISVILVRDTFTALLAWAHYVLGKFGTKVIGVAGSAGKSITIEMISRVLESRYSVHVGSDEYDGSGRLNVPLSLAQLSPSHKFAVIKLGMNQPGEMASMVESVQPEVGVITHIGSLTTHHFETSEEFAREQSLLFEYLSPGGLAVLNYDDDLCRAMASRTRAQVKTVGVAHFGPDMMLYNIKVAPDGTGYDLRCGSDRYVGQWVPLWGRSYLYGLMAALTVGFYYDIPTAEALDILPQLRPLPGRMNAFHGKNGCRLIDDSYDANPESTAAALDWLDAIKAQYRRVFFVFGDMDHLGKHSRAAHREVGRRATEIADVVITQGVQAAIASRAALDQGMQTYDVHTTYTPQDTAAILAGQYELNDQDVVLIKGGALSRMELVTQALLENFEDRAQLVRQDLSEEVDIVTQPLHLSWVEVDAAALANNVRLLKSLVGDEVTLMAIVKADGYGHGAVKVAQTALLNGAGYLGVSSLGEALELREAGIRAPVLVMNYVPALLLRQAIQQDITLTLYDLDMARAYERVARDMGRQARIHVKVDTGMGRLGLMPGEVIPLFRQLATARNIDVEGIYTHFSQADDDFEYTAEQLTIFNNVLRPVQTTRKFKYIHAANSAAAIVYPQSHFNMVRMGLALYGMHPSHKVRLPEGIEPVISWKTTVAQVKTLPPGHPVGYGNTYIAYSEERVAILPVGYADGFRRAPKNWGEVLIHGQRAQIIGRVSMEKTIVRVTHIPDVAIGDEVVLLGRQRDEVITAEDVAQRLDTNNYEVVTTILPRIPRR